MRAVLQRVSSASVEVDGAVVGAIQRGLLCLIGIAEGDTEADVEYIVRKVLRCRAWPDEADKAWAADVTAIQGEVLCVSQFTLHARMSKPKPSYSRAMPPQQAKDMYESLLARMRSEYQAQRVQDGVFGAMMSVRLVNDGPVTLLLDSKERD